MEGGPWGEAEDTQMVLQTLRRIVEKNEKKDGRNNIMCMSDHRTPAAAFEVIDLLRTASFLLMMTSFVTTAQSIYRGDA